MLEGGKACLRVRAGLRYAATDQPLDAIQCNRHAQIEALGAAPRSRLNASRAKWRTSSEGQQVARGKHPPVFPRADLLPIV